MNKDPLFHAILMPHRSISLTGIRWVVGIYALLAAIPATYFLFSGAWPVLGFLGLDALALWWALGFSKKRENDLEEIVLWPDSLQIRRISANGRHSLESVNPFWIRLHLDRDDENRIISIRLLGRQKNLELGAFLPPDEKTAFARTFGIALARARN